MKLYDIVITVSGGEDLEKAELDKAMEELEGFADEVEAFAETRFRSMKRDGKIPEDIGIEITY